MNKKIKPEDPEQYERFLEKAREIGCEDLSALDEVMKPEMLKNNKPKQENGS